MRQKTVSINNIARLSAGINLSRGKDIVPESSVYSMKDHESDLASGQSFQPCLNNLDNRESHVIKAGDIVVNLGTRRCSIVTKNNENKIIKNSFVKIELTDSFIDPWFLCYSINESSIFKESISTDVLSVIRPLSVSILGKAWIYLPTMAEQKTIGNIYRNLCRIRYLNKKRNELLDKALNRLVTKMEEK